MRLRVLLDRGCDLAVVVGPAARRGDRAQGPRRGGEHEAFADVRCTPTRHERLRETRLRCELGHRCRRGHLLMHDHGHRITALGNVDGRLEQIAERQLAETLGQCDPARHGARHRHRVPAALGGCLRLRAVLRLKVRRRPRGRCTARGVQSMQPLAVPHDAEGVRAQTIADRLDDRHHRSGRDRSVDRVAAFHQHAHAGLHGHGVRRRHHVAAEHRQALARITAAPVEMRRAHDLPLGPRKRCGCCMSHAGIVDPRINAATCSPMASAAVRPGDSMPYRWTSPATPCSAGPWMTKSCAPSCGARIFGRTPE